jgi:hypothetical protein
VTPTDADEYRRNQKEDAPHMEAIDGRTSVASFPDGWTFIAPVGLPRYDTSLAMLTVYAAIVSQQYVSICLLSQ